MVLEIHMRDGYSPCSGYSPTMSCQLSLMQAFASNKENVIHSKGEYRFEKCSLSLVLLPGSSVMFSLVMWMRQWGKGLSALWATLGW